MSAKTTSTPGRRTPLSLTGAVSKGKSNKGESNAAHNNGNNANGHTTTTNNNKQDNKMQQQKTEQQKSNNLEVKENPNNNKKVQQQQQQQQQQNDNNKKSIEKNQNGVNNNKQQQQQQQANENKQNQQQNKEGKQQQNSNNKLNENDKKEKSEKQQQQDKSEKLEAKSKENKKLESEIQENTKKDEKKSKEDNKADKNESVNKINEKTENDLQEKNDDKLSKAENDTEVVANQQKPDEEKIKEMEVAEELQQQPQQKSLPATPKSNRARKSATPSNKAANEKTPPKVTTLSSAIKATPVKKREVTTTIDDIDMEPLAVESSPVKSRQPEEVANLHIAPTATSTPGKIVLPKRNSGAPKSDVQLAMQSGYSPERPRAFAQISGRKSIRPITEYTPSKFQSNLQFRESYRRINTELDNTNTSMNVTVGSEVPNNLSFSFFGRGRKRDRTPPQLSQSAIGELHMDMEMSPPKKARLEGFFSVVASPLTLLRNRFSKATLQSSTPVKLEEKLNTAEDEIEVQNVSGVSIHEDLTNTEKATEIGAPSDNDVTLNEDAKEAKSKRAYKDDFEDKDVFIKSEKTTAGDQSDIKIIETPLQVAVGDPSAKNKRCIIM